MSPQYVPNVHRGCIDEVLGARGPVRQQRGQVCQGTMWVVQAERLGGIVPVSDRDG